MDNSILPKIKDLIQNNEAIGIAVGRDYTVDEMASALSLYLLLSSMNKKVSIASSADPLVEVSNLVGINKVKKGFDGQGGDLVVSFPYQEGEIEKVSYTLDGGYLNIIVKAGEKGLSFTDRDVDYKRGGSIPSLVFIIGTPRLSDLGNIFDPEKMRNTVLVNIDNKVDNQGFGDVVYVSPKFSSVSEQIADFISYLTPNIDPDIAQNLFSGISFATDNFQNPTTSALAFEMAGILMKSGAKRETKTRKEPRPFEDPFFGQRPQVGQSPQQKRQDEQKFAPKRDQNQRFSPPSTPPQRGQAQSYSQKDEEDFSFDQPKKDQRDQKTPPSDWLTPKIYKGSTNI